jgi:hypothetical protein
MGWYLEQIFVDFYSKKDPLLYYFTKILWVSYQGPSSYFPLTSNKELHIILKLLAPLFTSLTQKPLAFQPQTSCLFKGLLCDHLPIINCGRTPSSAAPSAADLRSLERWFRDLQITVRTPRLRPRCESSQSEAVEGQLRTKKHNFGAAPRGVYALRLYMRRSHSAPLCLLSIKSARRKWASWCEGTEIFSKQIEAARMALFVAQACVFHSAGCGWEVPEFMILRPGMEEERSEIVGRRLLSLIGDKFSSGLGDFWMGSIDRRVS